MSVGASVFVRNAIKYDYCILECIKSVMALDQVVVMDCESDDGTTEMLYDFFHRQQSGSVKLLTGAKWECAENYTRLAILANHAASFLTTDWHFMIQADEVLHERGVQAIFDATRMHMYKNADSFAVRRINLWGGMDSYIKFDLPTNRKPVSDTVVRLARRGVPAFGDAESLHGKMTDYNLVDHIPLFHYGFVRKNEIQKVKDMQTWFNGKNGQVDSRILEMEKDGVFRPEVFFNKEETAPLYLSHPKVSKQWADERRGLFEKA